MSIKWSDLISSETDRSRSVSNGNTHGDPTTNTSTLTTNLTKNHSYVNGGNHRHLHHIVTSSSHTNSATNSTIINHNHHNPAHSAHLARPIMAGRGEARRASVMEYEQSVLFGQYHEKLASFARLQARKTPRKTRLVDYEEDLDIDSSTTKRTMFQRRLITVLTALGNWPLLFCLGIIISFLSFAIDVATNCLLQGE